jgi:glycosyltransferase involved in cell wall biosynthesis
LYTWAFKKSPLVIFLNREDAGLFVEKGIIKDEQVFLSPGAGIDTEHFSPRTASQNPRFIFLFLGRLLLDKGIEELMQAFQQLREREEAVECWVGGDDRAQNPAAIHPPKWQRYMEQPGVKYLGLVDDVRPYLAQADVLVLPSYREGMPMVVLEAMAMEKPVIATQTAGCQEAVTEGVNGWLVPVKSVTPLRDAMSEALHTPPARLQEMGRAGRARAVQHFERHLVQEAFLQAIRRLMGQVS